MNNTFRIKISGKLEHIVTNMQSRLLNIPSTEPKMIQPHYHLTTLSLDKVKSLGFPTSEKTNANLLEFQMKLLVENGRGFLCGVSFAAWNDPYRQRHGMEWRMVEINLVKLSDPAAKLPPRYAGIIAVSLNTSYLQRQTNNKWSSYITDLPAWMEENKYITDLPVWMEEHKFEMLKTKIIQHNKMVRLADQKGNAETPPESSKLFAPGDGDVHLSVFDKDKNEFVDKTLSNLMQEAKIDYGETKNINSEEKTSDLHEDSKQHGSLYNHGFRPPRSSSPKLLRAAPNRCGRYEDSLLDADIPPLFLSRAENPLLLPRSPLKNPAPLPFQPHRPSEEELLAKEDFRLNNFRKERRNVTFHPDPGSQVIGGAKSKVVRNQPVRKMDARQQHQYEEIPEILSTPKSRLNRPLPPVLHDNINRQQASPPSSAAPSSHTVVPPPCPPASPTAPPYERPSTTSVSNAWRHVDDEEDSWYKESYAEEQLRLKSLIDQQLMKVHRLEQEINQSMYGEIYEDQPCAMLYDQEIAWASTNPQLLSNDPVERLAIMRKVRDNLVKATMDRRVVLEKLQDVELYQSGQRRSKRLQEKPRKRYNNY